MPVRSPRVVSFYYEIKRDRGRYNSRLSYAAPARVESSYKWLSNLRTFALTGREPGLQPSGAFLAIQVGSRQSSTQQKDEDLTSLMGVMRSESLLKATGLNSPSALSVFVKAVAPLMGATILPLFEFHLCYSLRAVVPLMGTNSFLCPPEPPEPEPYTTGQAQ